MVKFDRSEVIAILSPGEEVCLSVTGSVGDHEFVGSDCIWVIEPPLYPKKDEHDARTLEGTAISLEAHPNPFNPVVQISFNVPAQGPVLIQIYDISGRLVRTLESSVRTQGIHTTAWNGTNDAGGVVASGVYFCRFSMGGSAVTKKLMLLR
jgi:hypothetical protein